MKAYVTGAQGFVGGWLLRHLAHSGDHAISCSPSLDVTDGKVVYDEITSAAPDAIYHLAGLANVGASWDDPVTTFAVNAVGTQHVLEAARKCARPPRVLLVSSAEVYGMVKPDQLPLKVDSPLAPATPYAASKVAAEYLGVQAYLGWSLPVIRVRSFNHIGPGQAPSFGVSGIARRIVEAQLSGADSVLVGNLSARRDFTDVRDVVRAYRMLVEGGEPGEVYNVCSGHDVSMQEIVDRLIAISGIDVELRTDPALFRPVDLPVLRGDASRLEAATGWTPECSLDDSLERILVYWREQLSAS